MTALGLVLAATGINLAGTRTLARVAMFGFICEIIGALVVGIYLLLFQRHHSIAFLVDYAGIGAGGHYLPAFLAASLVGTYTCYGFEACGDVAEETRDPGVGIPKAMRMTIYVGASASAFIAVALVLAVPDIGLRADRNTDRGRRGSDLVPVEPAQHPGSRQPPGLFVRA